MEDLILTAPNPIEFDRNAVQEITINGEKGLWLNKSEIDNLISYQLGDINKDSNPRIIKKKPTKLTVQNQTVKVSYLRPPTPPNPGELIIQKEPNKVIPAAPPLIIRQIPDAPEEKLNPLVVREAPPINYGQNFQIEPQIITIPGKILPPPPRKVIINREYYYINTECNKEKKKKTHKIKDISIDEKYIEKQNKVSEIQASSQQINNVSNGYFYSNNNINNPYYSYTQPMNNYSYYYNNF